MTHLSAPFIHRAAAACALAAALVAFPALPAYADDAANLADDVAAEETVANKAQKNIETLVEDPSSKNLDAAISTFSNAKETPGYTFDSIDPSASVQYQYALLQLKLAEQQRELAQQKLEAMKEALQSGAHEDTQTELVYIQDYMASYDAYLQGAQSAISSASDTLKAAARGTVDDGDSISSTVDQLTALANSVDEQRSSAYERLQELSKPASNKLEGTDLSKLQQAIEQYHNYQEQASLIMQQMGDTLKSAATRGTAEGSAGDNFGMALVGAGVGVVMGAGVCFVALRRRPNTSNTTA